VSKDRKRFTLDAISIKNVHRLNTVVAPPPRY